MNSSTSSSEAGWRRFLRVYAGTLLALGAVAYALVLAIDPYNTGRFTPFDRIVVGSMGPRFEHVGLARNPDFDSAVFGNSTGQLVDPARIGALAGGRFVSLTAGGTGPVEQLATMKFFRLNHAQPGALIVTMDTSWCQDDSFFARDRINHPFPFWLYDDDPLAYLAEVMTFRTITFSRRKVLRLLGRRPGPERADGYDDFEKGRMWRYEEAWARLGPDRRLAVDAPGAAPAREESFAALDELDRVIAGATATKVVLAFMPQYAGTLPAAASPEGRRLALCKARAARIARERERVAVIDMMVDAPETRAVENFWDPLHYRSHVAREIEDRIAARLRML